MWLERFLDTISQLFPAHLNSGIREALGKLNPDRIYVENVRAVLGVSHERAVKICETAVRQGVFARMVQVLCPDGQAAVEADSEDRLPLTVICWNEEDGHFDEIEMPVAGLQKLVFYRLNDARAASIFK